MCGSLAAIGAGQAALAAEVAADSSGFGDQIVVTATRANTQPPITSSLETTQPQSIINRAVIANVVPATADFNDVAVLSPGASQTTNGNGPRLSESKIILCGFCDRSYNVTFDGVPFGDTNDPTRHSTSYFPNGTSEQIVVDRGPAAPTTSARPAMVARSGSSHAPSTTSSAAAPKPATGRGTLNCVAAPCRPATSAMS